MYNWSKCSRRKRPVGENVQSAKWHSKNGPNMSCMDMIRPPAQKITPENNKYQKIDRNQPNHTYIWVPSIGFPLKVFFGISYFRYFHCRFFFIQYLLFSIFTHYWYFFFRYCVHLRLFSFPKHKHSSKSTTQLKNPTKITNYFSLH